MKLKTHYLVILITLAFIVGCGGGSGVEEFTEGGYPKVSGKYAVGSSNCEFAPTGSYFRISQDEADLSISVGIDSPSSETPNDNEVPVITEVVGFV